MNKINIKIASPPIIPEVENYANNKKDMLNQLRQTFQNPNPTVREINNKLNEIENYYNSISDISNKELLENKIKDIEDLKEIEEEIKEYDNDLEYEHLLSKVNDLKNRISSEEI